MTKVRQPRVPSAALGVAILMGVMMTGLALLSIFIGLGLDGILGLEKRWATLVCVMAGMPLNLGLAVWLARKLLARIIPQSARSIAKSEQAGAAPGEDQDQ